MCIDIIHTIKIIMIVIIKGKRREQNWRQERTERNNEHWLLVIIGSHAFKVYGYDNSDIIIILTSGKYNQI